MVCLVDGKFPSGSTIYQALPGVMEVGFGILFGTVGEDDDAFVGKEGPAGDFGATEPNTDDDTEDTAEDTADDDDVCGPDEGEGGDLNMLPIFSNTFRPGMRVEDTCFKAGMHSQGIDCKVSSNIMIRFPRALGVVTILVVADDDDDDEVLTFC